MRISVELQRVGQSRVSWEGIPIVARVVMGSRFGENLLPDRLRDLDCAKAEASRRLRRRLGTAVEIQWLDRTDEGKAE